MFFLDSLKRKKKAVLKRKRKNLKRKTVSKQKIK